MAFYYETFINASLSGKREEDDNTGTSLDSNLFVVTPSSKIPSIFKSLRNLFEKTGAPVNTALMISSLITELLTELVMEQIAFYTKCAEIPSYLDSLKKDLDESYMQTWHLDIMEERYKVCKYRIVHDFTEHFSIPPISYLIRRRISAAKELLGETELAINQIAATVGIDNMNHFIYLFKKEVGMTPSSWRKNVRMHESLSSEVHITH